MGEQRGIVAVLKTAIQDYAEFPTEDLNEAVIAGLHALDTDLTENGYVQSERAEVAAAKIEEQMNDADAAPKADEETE